MNMNTIQNRYIPVAQWPEFYPWPSVSGLRSLIFNRKKNGFCQVIKRSGSRILIDEFEFARWMEKKNDKK